MAQTAACPPVLSLSAIFHAGAPQTYRVANANGDGRGGRLREGGRAAETVGTPCPRSATPAERSPGEPGAAGEAPTGVPPPRGASREGGRRGKEAAGQAPERAAGRAWAAPGPEIRALRGGPARERSFVFLHSLLHKEKAYLRGWMVL